MDELRFRFFRLRVCLYCRWYLRHWPAEDISEKEWRECFEDFDGDAWEAFMEGWCRD